MDHPFAEHATRKSELVHQRWDACAFVAALEAAVLALGEHAASLDALNVFPVADRDTGTNLLLTAQAALRAARAASDTSLAAVTRSAAHAALRAAHGNSGVILSQFFRAWAEIAAQREYLDAAAMSAGFARADTLARQALLQPVEGTMITVLRAAAEAAQEAAANGLPLAELLAHVRDAALAAVARTPELLPILRQQGVVDAGAQGLAVLLDAWAAAARGERPTLAPMRTTAPPTHSGAGDPHGYCFNALLRVPSDRRNELLQTLASYGESIELVGDDALLRVHLHTQQPDLVIECLRAYGRLDSLALERLSADGQDTIIAEPRQSALLVLSPAPTIRAWAHRLGALALAPSPTLTEPSRLAARLATLPVDRLLVLPARQEDAAVAREAARQLERPRLIVLPTQSLAAQLTALLVYEPGHEDHAEEKLLDLLARLRTVEIDQEGTPETPRWIARSGTWHAMHPALEEALRAGLAHLHAQEADLCTLVIGEAIGDVTGLHRAVRDQWPHLEIELFWGHQPAPALSIALE
ncbi:DAK2 domain-containing protein [Thermomicrobium sp.]